MQQPQPDERFTFHSSRMRMKHVTPEELVAMNAQTERASLELADARPDAVASACLVAIMAQGNGYHCHAEAQITGVDPADLREHCRKVDTSNADALVLSACVQMPSLPSIQPVEDEAGLPVLSAATATVFTLLSELGLRQVVPGAGRLLSGEVSMAPARGRRRNRWAGRHLPGRRCPGSCPRWRSSARGRCGGGPRVGPMEENRARRVVDALRERGINARMAKAGVYQFGIRVSLPGGREAVWDSDGTAGLEAQVMRDGMLVGFVPVIDASEDFDEQQVVDAITRTDYDHPIARRRTSAVPPAAPLPPEGGLFRRFLDGFRYR